MPGAVSETTGTVLATIRCAQGVDDALDTPEVFRGPAFSDNLYYEMVFSEQSAGILERFRNECAPELGFPKLDCLAAESPKGSRGLQLHPEAYRRDADHLFVGLQPHHSIGDKVRAILEGVADELAGQVRRLCGSSLPEVIHAAGGAAKSDLWLRIKSESLGIPVRAVECEEPTSLGSARLAIAALNASGGIKTT
jgi:sugar (pentulose or hexulose) kinase